MTDAAFSLLYKEMKKKLLTQEENSLWVADENALTAASQLASSQQGIAALSNRVDVHDALKAAGFNSQFNDFNTDSYPSNSLQQIFYRVSKEKPVVHRVINLAFDWLKPGGELFICGEKSDGTKTYIDKAGKLFGQKVRAQKDGQIYSACIPKSDKNNSDVIDLNESDYSDDRGYLDDSDYEKIRLIGEQNNLSLFSKPGTFGWNKIDRGSEILVNELIRWLPDNIDQLSLLDLGCGYGYISLMASTFKPGSLTATDNNAAALLAITKNATQAQIDINIVGADCAQQIEQPVDIILCNPPFHQGFSIDGSLTDKFLRQTKRLLKPGGKALYVVNQFIPLERKAAEHFPSVNKLLETDGFKLVELS
jgi:16S rRNA (guanine1207-N2)-methyltransferase